MTPEPTVIPPEIAALSFEAALRELETIVRQLEDGRVELEASIDLYGRGALLRRHCEAKLAQAKAKIEQVVGSGEGELGVKSFDVG